VRKLKAVLFTTVLLTILFWSCRWCGSPTKIRWPLLELV